MPELKGTKTEENLKEAFAGESQANRRYLYFAQKADVEGYPDVAALFRSVAEGETGHAFGHFDFLAEVGDPVTGEAVGSTEDNLKSAIAGETYEYTEMYPGLLEDGPRRGLRGDRRVARDARPGREEPRRPLHPGPREPLVAHEGPAPTVRGVRRRTALARRTPSDEVPMTTTYDPFHPKYFDEADLREEMARVFDLCHGCRLCFKFCTAFPTLFAAIDNHDDQDSARMTDGGAGPGRRRVLQLQALLRQLPVHPGPARVGARLPAPHAPRRADAAPSRGRRNVRVALTDQALGRTDLAGKVATKVAPLANKALATPGSTARKAMEKVTGIASERLLPPYAEDPLLDVVEEAHAIARLAGAQAGLGDHLPDVPGRVPEPAGRQGPRAGLERNGIDCELPAGQVCCGAPWLHSGDVDHFRKQGRKNVTVLADAIRAARRRGEEPAVVVPQPTCGYILKYDYKDYLGGADAELVAEHTYDAAEYLMKLHKAEGTAARHRLHRATCPKPSPTTRRATSGRRTSACSSRDLVKLTGAKVTVVAECSGIDGTWGYRAEHYEDSRAVARKMVDAIDKAGGEVVAGDCHLANGGILQETGRQPVHPVSLVARAYGIPEEGP